VAIFGHNFGLKLKIWALPKFGLFGRHIFVQNREAAQEEIEKKINGTVTGFIAKYERLTYILARV